MVLNIINIPDLIKYVHNDQLCDLIVTDFLDSSEANFGVTAFKFAMLRHS